MIHSFIGLREASRIYHISSRTLLNAVHTGELKAYKPGGRRLSIRCTDIETWIMSKPAQ
jgi:excisionase family DNA binding protein